MELTAFAAGAGMVISVGGVGLAVARYVGAKKIQDIARPLIDAAMQDHAEDHQTERELTNTKLDAIQRSVQALAKAQKETHSLVIDILQNGYHRSQKR